MKYTKITDSSATWRPDGDQRRPAPINGERIREIGEIGGNRRKKKDKKDKKDKRDKKETEGG